MAIVLAATEHVRAHLQSGRHLQARLLHIVLATQLLLELPARSATRLFNSASTIAPARSASALVGNGSATAASLSFAMPRAFPVKYAILTFASRVSAACARERVVVPVQTIARVQP